MLRRYTNIVRTCARASGGGRADMKIIGTGRLEEEVDNTCTRVWMICVTIAREIGWRDLGFGMPR